MPRSVLIRQVQQQDIQPGGLWDGYNAFYGRHGETALPEPVTEATWQRFFDPAEPVFALVAEVDGNVVGLTHYLYHRSTTRIELVCYLQDLFTVPSERGRGVGRALIEGVYGKVCWHQTGLLANLQSNATGRLLYDKVAEDTGFIVYNNKS